MLTADHPQKAAESSHLMSYKCLCKSAACSPNADHLTEASASLENYHCPQLQDVVSSRGLPCTSDIRHVQCTCRTKSQLSSALCCTACACHHVSKPDTFVHIRCDQFMNDTKAEHTHCYTCGQHHVLTSCCHAIIVSNIAANVCPHCVASKCTQVKGPDSQLVSRHSSLYRIQEEQEKELRRRESDSVIMDVNEWQRRHVEQLDRQKLEILGGPVESGDDQWPRVSIRESQPELSLDDSVCGSSDAKPQPNSLAKSCLGNCALEKEMDLLKSEMISERKKVEYYQVLLERTQEELENIRASAAVVNQDTLVGNDMDLDSSASVVVDTSVTDSISSILSDETLVSCNEANRSASVLETDEGVGTEDHSQLIGPSSHQTYLHSDVQRSTQVSSVHQQLLRKNEQLKFLRQMLKELSSSHESLLEKYLTLEQKVVENQSSSSCAIVSELQLCVSKLKPIVDVCCAVLLNNDTPDVTSLLHSNASTVEALWNKTELAENVASLHTDIDEISRAAINKLIAAHIS